MVATSRELSYRLCENLMGQSGRRLGVWADSWTYFASYAPVDATKDLMDQVQWRFNFHALRKWRGYFGANINMGE